MSARQLLINISGLILLSLSTQATFAAEGRILDGVEAEQAGKDAFEAEEKLFKSIGNSIALSLATCELQSVCNPSVDKDELDTLIKQLDDRINNLIVRQENSEEDFTDLLTAYVNHRENYINYQEKLDEIANVGEPAADQTEEDVFSDEGTGEESEAAAATGQKEEKPDFSVFEDIDEALPGTGPDALQEEPAPEE